MSTISLLDRWSLDFYRARLSKWQVSWEIFCYIFFSFLFFFFCFSLLFLYWDIWSILRQAFVCFLTFLLYMYIYILFWKTVRLQDNICSRPRQPRKFGLFSPAAIQKAIEQTFTDIGIDSPADRQVSANSSSRSCPFYYLLDTLDILRYTKFLTLLLPLLDIYKKERKRRQIGWNTTYRSPLCLVLVMAIRSCPCDVTLWNLFLKRRGTVFCSYLGATRAN